MLRIYRIKHSDRKSVTRGSDKRKTQRQRATGVRGMIRTLGNEEAQADNDDNTNPCTYPPISAMEMSDALQASQ
jgi:hypothetical protein